MSIISQDLQASHQILLLLEQSNRRVDEVLDTIPGLFAIIQRNEFGTILKGNIGIAKKLNCTEETLIGKNFSALFLPETWNIFQSQLEEINNPDSNPIEFELNINEGPEEKQYLWKIRKFLTQRSKDGEIITVVGNDLTELRKAERHLTEIFASIPLGIFTLGSNHCIEGQYSANTEWLLGGNSFEGKSFQEIILTPILPRLSIEHRESFQFMLSSIGRDELYFDAVVTRLPTEVFYPLAGSSPEDGRYLGLRFHPIAYGGIVKKILAIVEDRTQIVTSRKAEAAAKLLEEKSIARIMQIKSAPADILPMVIPELDTLINRLKEETKNRARENVQYTLHGIKGNSRIAGFKFLKEQSHSLENQFRALERNNLELSWEKIDAGSKDIAQEWEEVKRLYRVLIEGVESKSNSKAKSTNSPEEIKKNSLLRDLFQRFQRLIFSSDVAEFAAEGHRIQLALASLSYSDLSEFGKLMNYRVKETAKSLSKEVNFHFYAEGVYLDTPIREALSEALSHIVNNCVAHGIEDQKTRETLGKTPVGNIWIAISEGKRWTEIQVEDDGGGINLERVRQTAIKKGLITLPEALGLKEAEIRNLIFKPGFSTEEKTSDISGRGVGMSAVQRVVEDYQGTLKVVDRHPYGTKITFTLFPHQSNEKASFGIFMINQLVSAIKQAFTQMNTSSRMEINMVGDFKSGFILGLIYMNMNQVVLALTTIIGYHAMDRKVTIYLKKGPSEILTLNVELGKPIVSGVSSSTRQEFELALRPSQNVIKQHGGSVESGEQDKLTIHVGQVLVSNSIGEFGYIFSNEIEKAEMSRIDANLKSLAARFGVSLTKINQERSNEFSSLKRLIIITDDAVIPKGSIRIDPIFSDKQMMIAWLEGIEASLGITERNLAA